MFSIVRRLACVLALAMPVVLLAATDLPREQTIALRVQVDAAGKVSSHQVVDPNAVEALTRTAIDVSRKISFTPARKDGTAVASETTLYVTLLMEPQGDGRFGLKVKAITNGPQVLQMGKLVTPNYQQRGDRSALIVVGVSVGADGNPDMASFRQERVEMRVESSFAEARYIDAVENSVRGSRFLLDKVDGASIPTHVSLPYRFGGGGGRGRGRKEEDKQQAPSDGSELDWKQRAETPGIELPRVIFVAPVVPKKEG